MAAWADDDHVDRAAATGTEAGSRRLAGALGEARGRGPSLPDGGFYLWVAAPEGDAWGFARRLAERGRRDRRAPASSTATPRPGYVRLAMVQPDERIDLAAQRVSSARALV